MFSKWFFQEGLEYIEKHLVLWMTEEMTLRRKEIYIGVHIKGYLILTSGPKASLKSIGTEKWILGLRLKCNHMGENAIEGFLKCGS